MSESSSGTSSSIKRVEMADLSTESKHGGAPFLQHQVELIRGVKVRASVVLGEVELSVGKLLDMRDGEVLKLDRLIDQPLEMLLDGKVVALGELVVVGDNLGLRITEIAQR
ncbi:MAG: FliM/FliN family flagellar motor switch protein [Nevskia sp.]|jgi:flagellar motor switch protein FliN/FliY|nr:FliM/FliN family flagellar motor switch protein [Nevskia sp.]MCK9383360.1 FliM/FliN family flagellar motor switch protein [Nevskia sp.]